MSGDDLIDAYLADLGQAREAPSRGALDGIIRRHVDRYPFASIGPRLGDPLPLAPEDLHDRIVVRRRGGYCFEQNGLLFEVLTGLGYDTRMQMARVLLSGNPHPGLTHRVTRATVDGVEYVVDVGFGPKGPPLSVPMHAEPGPDDRYRVVRTGAVEYRLDTLEDGEWIALYRFDDVPYGQADAELGHFYSHRHPDAVFVNALVASRILDGEVRSLRNREYHVIRPTGTDVETVTDSSRMHAILTEELGLEVSPAESERLFVEASA